MYSSSYIDTTQSRKFKPSLNQRCWQHRDSQPVHDPYCCTNHWSCDERRWAAGTILKKRMRISAMKEWLPKIVIRIMEYYSKSKKSWAKNCFSYLQINSLHVYGMFSHPYHSVWTQKKTNPPTKWSAAECVNSETHEFVNTGFFLIFCTRHFLEMIVLVSHSGIPIIQAKISCTGEQWSKTLRSFILVGEWGSSFHGWWNNLVSSPSPGPSTAYISPQHSSLFWSLRWCFVLVVVETKLLKRERSYSKDHQNSPNLQKRQSTTLPQASSKSSQIRCQKKERAGMRMRFESKPHGSQWFTSFNLIYVLVLFSGIFWCFCFMVSGIECW